MNDTSDRPVRTRFAPSPTGRLHLGNVRTAVFNWLWARHHGGAFVVRIEDTDVERNLEGSEASILEDLRWLGLVPDEDPQQGGPFGPYRQSERGAHYARALERLLADGHAYPCFCGPAEEAGSPTSSGDEPDAEDADAESFRRYPGTCRDIDSREARDRVQAGEDAVIRFRTPEVEEVEIVDEIRGPISFPGNDIDDFVLARSDGRPTYNFAVVVDDLAMEITDVIRGAGHLSNTPKQQLLYGAFGHTPPRFAHLPTVLAPGGGKLSKRSGSAGVDELRERGVPAAAVVNYLSLLGWSHPEEREILSLDELVDAVDLDRVGASDTRYDDEKFAWVSQQHIAEMPEAAFLSEARARVDRDRYPLDDSALDVALRAIRSRLSELSEINTHLAWVVPVEGERWNALRREVMTDPDARRVIGVAARVLQDVEPWEASAIKDALREVGKEAEARGAALFVPVRKIVTGDEHGPEIGALLEAAGKRAVLERIARATDADEV